MSLRWLRFAALNTLRNKRRSAVTVAIAALGTAAILIAGGFALATYRGLAENAARSTGHLIVATPAQFERDEETPLQHGLDRAEALARQLMADPSVRAVLPRVEFSGLVSNGDKSVVMVATGVDPDREFAIKGPFLTVTAGDVLSSGAGGDAPQVMLGERLARSLGATPGASLTLLASTTDGALNALDVSVRGVFSTGVPELDQRALYTDVATAQRLLRSERVSSLGVFLDRMTSTDAAQQRVAAALPSLAVHTWLDQAAFYQGVRSLYNRIFGALGAIIGVIVVFVVTNAMAMAIIERTREIGTLRAMGTLPRQLLRMLSLEGLLLGGTGALVGAAIAVAVAVGLLLFPVQMPPPPGRTVGYPLLIALEPGLYAATLFAMATLSTLAALLVARRTVRTPIVDALAHV